MLYSSQMILFVVAPIEVTSVINILCGGREEGVSLSNFPSLHLYRIDTLVTGIGLYSVQGNVAWWLWGCGWMHFFCILFRLFLDTFSYIYLKLQCCEGQCGSSGVAGVCLLLECHCVPHHDGKMLRPRATLRCNTLQCNVTLQWCYIVLRCIT